MKRACVIGWPIQHSRSPLIHGHWLAQYGIAGTYTREAVKPEDVGTFLSSLADRGFAGCNVTLPHKHAALAAAVHKDAAAIAIGAANTLWLEDGVLHAANTDAYGFMTHLSQSIPDWQAVDAPVSILGAGGAARALIHGFLEAGIDEIRLFNRTPARAEDLARHFGPRVTPHAWTDRERLSRDVGVLVNTTALGMIHGEPLDMDVSRLGQRTIVADIVYVPLETPLLAAARHRGLRTVDGLGMLLHQAVPGFEKWFGRKPEVTPELRALLVADIEGR
ncbi:MAG: shikimate dehydrogenase [Hyphomicrobiaceae bacterium]